VPLGNKERSAHPPTHLPTHPPPRLLAEEDVSVGSGGATPLLDAASSVAAAEVAALYSRGTVEREGMGGAKFNLYLIKKVRVCLLSVWSAVCLPLV